jgi:hypothetical protein
VADQNWIKSVAAVAPAFWSARTLVPVATLVTEPREFDGNAELLAAICRYDYSGGPTPVLSSTADFGGWPFHTRTAWHRVRLVR